MIKSSQLLNILKKNKIRNFVGVPDSVLKNFLNYLDKKKINNMIACNEGSAIGIAVGQHLSTKEMTLVYMQNSGLGNAINPLISIAHNKVYSIPMILLIGWRGHDQKDEPQHNLQGKITRNLLKLLNIKFCELKNKNDLKKINLLIKFSKKNSSPVAILVKKSNIFEKEKIIRENRNNLLRGFVIEELLKKITKNTKIISSTGYTSRELNQIRAIKKLNSGKDFYLVGGMGHTSSISTGVSQFSKGQVICLDGDGSLIMHLGSLINAGFSNKKNYKHILLNNGSHESVGGQKINTTKINFEKTVKSFGFKNFYYVTNKKSYFKHLRSFLKSSGPSFMQIQIKSKSLKNLGRPKNLIKIKENFLN